MPKITAEIWLLVDEDGNYATGGTKDEAIDAYSKEDPPQEVVFREGFPPDGAFRFIKFAVTLPLPEEVEVAVEIPAADYALTSVAVA